MNFFTKKRNELQRLCKKHGIPANLKNIEMAERLSLIYKEKENPVSNGSYKDKSNVEIIILDSDSDTDVQMEAPDIVSVAEKDCNEMNNVNVEHVLDEVHSSGLKDSVREPDQFLATSPLSEVKSSDLNIHCTVDSDNTVAEKDSNEKTNVDELYSSGLKYSVGEPDQCLVTLPLIEVKCSDLNIHHMVDSGTAGGNADVSEVKSASSQQQGQEESQMTLEGEKSEDNVRSLHLEENKQMSVIKDKIEDNQEFYQPTTTDLNAHQMVDSGTADGHVDACEESKMKFTPERSYNVDTFYAEDNMQMSVNVLEHFGNYMMMGEDLYGTPVRDTVAEKDSNEKTNVDEVHLSGLKYLFGEPDQCLTTSPLSEVKSSKIHHMVDSDAVAEKTNVDELHSSGLKYLFREPDQCLTTSPLSEVKSSDLNIHHMVDSGAVAGNADACEVRSVSLQCERSENNVGSFYLEEYTQMSVDKEQIEDNQELSPATPTDLDVVHMVDSGTAAGDADDCEGKSASLQVEDDQELHQATPTVSQPSETMSCNFSLQQLFALDTCEEEMQDLSEKDKTCMVADLEACIGLLPKNLEAATTKGSEVGTYFDPTILGNVVMETCRIDNVEKEINQDDCFSAQGEVGKFFDNDDFGVDELVQTVPQPSEMESFDFSLQQLFASDTASGDEDAYQKKLDSPSKTTPTASGEKNMVFSPKLHESKMTFQCERSSDNVVSFCFEENNRMSVNMEQIQDNKELSPAPSEENLELHQAAPCEDVNVLEEYGNYMMVREDSDGMPVQFLPTSDHNIHKMVVRDTCEEDMLKLSEKTCMVADPEEHIGFSPDELEASTTKGSEAETYFDQTTVGDVSKSVENSDVYDDISGVGEEDEIQPHMTSRKRKSSDEDDTIANSDEDLKADELVPTVPQPSEMESYTFSLQQLFSSDTASGDEEAHKAKFDSPSRATPTASGEKSMVFSPKPHESSMRHKEMGIEMSLPLKRARDSIGTHDMKENIKIDKEEVGSIMSKTKFAKRQPLQDLQQN